MIVTVTLNPALDRTVYIPEFKPGSVNRADCTLVDSGGKGINVSKALREMGTESVCCGLIAGSYGRQIKEYLASIGIVHDFVDVPGQTRVNIKIVDDKGIHTDINERGFEVSESDFERLKERISRYTKEGNIIVISGSAPPNLSVKAYGELCSLASAKSRLVVDAAGEFLKESLKSKPVFVKPNVAELESVVGSGLKTLDDIKRGARELIAMGAQNVAVSMGSEGALFVNPQTALLASTPNVEVIGPIGAGDVMVAGIAHSLQNRSDFTELARYSVAAGAASVTIEGTRMASRRTVLWIYSRSTVSEV